MTTAILILLARWWRRLRRKEEVPTPTLLHAAIAYVVTHDRFRVAARLDLAHYRVVLASSGGDLMHVTGDYNFAWLKSAQVLRGNEVDALMLGFRAAEQGKAARA